MLNCIDACLFFSAYCFNLFMNPFVCCTKCYTNRIIIRDEPVRDEPQGQLWLAPDPQRTTINESLVQLPAGVHAPYLHIYRKWSLRCCSELCWLSGWLSLSLSRSCSSWNKLYIHTIIILLFTVTELFKSKFVRWFHFLNICLKSVWHIGHLCKRWDLYYKF